MTSVPIQPDPSLRTIDFVNANSLEEAEACVRKMEREGLISLNLLPTEDCSVNVLRDSPVPIMISKESQCERLIHLETSLFSFVNFPGPCSSEELKPSEQKFTHGIWNCYPTMNENCDASACPHTCSRLFYGVYKFEYDIVEVMQYPLSSCTNPHSRQVYRTNQCYNTLTSLESVSSMLEVKGNEAQLSTWFGANCAEAVSVPLIPLSQMSRCIELGTSFAMITIHQPPQSRIFALLVFGMMLLLVCYAPIISDDYHKKNG